MRDVSVNTESTDTFDTDTDATGTPMIQCTLITGVSVTSDADVISGLMTSVSVTSVFSKLTLHIPRRMLTV